MPQTNDDTFSDNARLVGALSGSLQIFSETLAKRVWTAHKGSSADQMTILTIVEREPGLPSDLMRLVALTKQVISGNEELRTPLWQELQKREGLI